MGSLDHTFLKVFREEGEEQPITEQLHFGSTLVESELEVVVVPFTIEDTSSPVSLPIDSEKRYWRRDRPEIYSPSNHSDQTVFTADAPLSMASEIAPPSIPFRKAYKRKQRRVPLAIFPQQCQEVKDSPEETILEFSLQIDPENAMNNATVISTSPTPPPLTPSVLKMKRENMDSIVALACDPFKINPGQLTKRCRQILAQGRAGIDAVGEILDEAIRQDHRIVTFKGLSAGCGCSSLLMGVATGLAEQGFDILVLDAHFDRPCLANLAGLSPSCGWEEMIFCKKMIYDVAHPVILPFVSNNLLTDKTSKEGSQFLLAPLAESTSSSAVIASCKKEWLTIMASLTEQFDLILIDGGGFSPRSIDETIASMLRFGTDSFFLVEDLRYNGYLPTVELIEQANTFHLPCLGMIANFT